MQYSPLAVANTFISRHGAEGSLDHMKLQKLVYYAYGWWLAYNEQPILDEAPQVWKFGPVFESLYNALRPFGGSTITSPVAPPNASAPIVSEDVPSQWIDWVWNRYGHLSGLQLSDMTHEIGTPWQIEAQARNYRVPKNYPIPESTTKRYFQGLAADLN